MVWSSGRHVHKDVDPHRHLRDPTPSGSVTCPGEGVASHFHPSRCVIRETELVTSRSDRPLPATKRPVDDTPIHTADLPPLPTATYNIPATAWIEAPTELLEAGADIGQPEIMYKRRIGSWLLWRAGPASKAHARYVAIHADDLTRIHTFRLFPDRTGAGVGPSGTEHERFRPWKEELHETP